MKYREKIVNILKLFLVKVSEFYKNLSLPSHVRIGKGVFIDKTVKFIRPEHGEVVLEDGVQLWRYSEICGGVSIGECTFVNRDAYICPKVKIGKRVRIGPFVKLISDTHEIGTMAMRAGADKILSIEVGDGAWIGAGAIILGGCKVGKGAIVGAGAIVTKDIEENALYVSQAATFKKYIK